MTTTTATRAATVLLLGAFAAHCGGGNRNRTYAYSGLDEATAQNINIRQGPMPANHSFTGVYRSPQIGDVEMVQTGDAVVGRYEYNRGSCHVTARLEGNASGNLLRVRWREDHRECGRIAPVIGHAYFLYWVEEGDVPRGRLVGEWGYGEEDRGNGSWTAFKIMNRQPTMLTDQGGGGGGGGGEGAGAGGEADAGGGI